MASRLSSYPQHPPSRSEPPAPELDFEGLLGTIIGWIADTSPAELDQCLARSLGAICRDFGLAAAGILHVSPRRSTLSVRIESAWGTSGSVRDLIDAWPEPERRRLRDRVLWTSPVLLDSARGEPGLEPLTETLARSAYARALCTRLELDGTPVAVLLLLSRTADALGSRLLPRLRLVADTIAVALGRHDGSLAFREAESRFEKLVRAGPDAVVLTDEENRVVEWSDRCERLTRVPREGVLGRDLGALLVPEARQSDFRSWLAYTLTGTEAEQRPFEIGLETPSGTLEVELDALPLIRGGAMAHAFFLRDRTALRRLERDHARALAELGRARLAEGRAGADAGGDLYAPDSSPLSIVGDSPALRHALSVVDAVAETTATVLIQGESGVGKELFAQAIHCRSQRRNGPLVKVNCASVPQGLFESEFFGHVRGSFTGAMRDRAGRFEAAQGGTLFLDEVGEIPLELQAKLLRVLQEGTFERVGEEKTRRVDVRVVAATNRNLRAEVASGRFRADLFYRLNVFPIEVPPLRERREDIPRLARHFVEQYARANHRAGLALEAEHVSLLLRYDWPGNVRELANVIERAVILSPTPPLKLASALGVPSELPASPSAPRATQPAAPTLTVKGGDRLLSDAEVRDFERDNLLAVLERCDWRLQGERGAAALLGLSPSTVRDRIRRFGLKRSR